MGIKLSWSGLAIMEASYAFMLNNGFVIAGALILILGVILQWMDK